MVKLQRTGIGPHALFRFYLYTESLDGEPEENKRYFV